MSDLNDLIVTNAVRAYNEGFERGVASEQERIVELLNKVAIQQHKVIEFNPDRKDASGRETVIATTYQLIALIKGEPK